MVKRLTNVFLDNLRSSIEDDSALHDKVHILSGSHTVDFGIDQMKRDGNGLTSRQLDSSAFANDFNTTRTKGNFSGIHKTHFVREGILEHNAISNTLDCILDVVGKRKGKIARKLAVKGFAGSRRDIRRRQEHIVGDRLGYSHILLINIGKHALNDRFILELVRRLGKTHALAEDNNLLAGVIGRQGDVVVDFLQDEHEKNSSEHLYARTGAAKPPNHCAQVMPPGE